MPASTAPAAKTAILAALAARPALASVTRVWGGPTQESEMDAEMIFLGRARGAGAWRTLGAGVRHESYTIELHTLAANFTTEQATEERAFALLDEVSAALDADKFLAGGGAQLLYTPAAIESWEQVNVPTTQQWVAHIVAQIRCEAKFTP